MHRCPKTADGPGYYDPAERREQELLTDLETVRDEIDASWKELKQAIEHRHRYK